ncbi:MAG TPA: adenylate/guanylate cyclase domain-containing protein [Nocardioidaceae bacterium]|nr:adenylate/guanylate cyclase domain-containing protein [Nocardioidaceae bacterium]
MSGRGGTHASAAAAPYFSRLEVDWMAREPDTRHRRLTGSLMSADLSGFTALSERLAGKGKEGSERLTAMVNGCFTAIISAAQSEGGDVLKFGGDALLLWFDGDEHPLRATRAAARMQRAIGATRFARAGLRMSVGVHTDAFDMFLVGHDEWRELVLAGHPVSATVELEAAAESGEVRVSEAVARHLRADQYVAPDGPGVVLALSAIPLPRLAAPTTPLEAPAVALPPRIRADVDALAGLGGEHRLATVVFAELEGTDARVEADPTGMEESLDSLVRATQAKADRYRLRFLYTDVIANGIKLICTAGAPTSTGEDEEAGLRFAVDLVAGDPRHRLHIGVNRGRVFAGFLGSDTRRTYTVMGDPVNLAARLMSKAAPGQVVASEEVVRRSRATFRLTPLAPFLVKGKQAPVNAHLVGAPTGERRGQLQSTLPLIGRQEELAVLDRAIAAAAAGHGQVVELTGDAGIGKTRLLEAVAHDPRIVVLVGTECQPYDGLSPYASARALLRRALGIPSSDSATAAGEMLRSTVERIAPDLLPMLPLLAVPLDAEVAATPETDAVAEQFRTSRIHDSVAALLAAALPQTTLLVVEDVYYADGASLELFRALAATVAPRPWLITVTRRPEGPGLVADQVSGTVLKLAALSEVETSQLADLAAGGAAFHPLQQKAVTQRAGGNPLFLLQLVSSSREGMSADDLPESIERVVATRIDRLAPEDRVLLRQAAVVGRVFHPDVLDALRVANDARPATQRDWDALGDLIEPAGADRWRFRHALFRDVAYEGLPFARRRRMHRAVGDLLEAGVAGEPDAALLSEHFWLAGDAERTWRYSVAAGDHAWASYAIGEAIAAYQRALGVRQPQTSQVDPAEIAAVCETLGDALERAGRYDEADRAYRRAARSVRASLSLQSQARLLRKRAIAATGRGGHREAMRILRRALTAVDSVAEGGRDLRSERAEILLHWSGVEHRLGHHREARRWATDAIAEAEASGNLRAQAHGLNLVQVAITHGAGAPDSTPGEQALAIFRELGDTHYEGNALNNLGVEAQERGAWTEAQEYFSASADAFDRSGDGIRAATARNNDAEIMADRGDWAEAIATFRHVVTQWDASHYGVGVAVARANSGLAAARLGDFELARTMLQQALEQFDALDVVSYSLNTLVRLAETESLAGDLDRAAAHLEAVDARAVTVEPFPYTVLARGRVIGWLAAQRGDMKQARSQLREVRESARSVNRFEEGLALHSLAQVTEDAAQRRELLAEAELVFEGLGVHTVASPPLPL